MAAKKVSRRALSVSVGGAGVLLVLVILLLTMGDGRETGVIESVRPVAQEGTRVFRGPDPNAVYLRVRANPHQLIDAPKRYLHRAEGEVVAQMQGFLQDQSPGDPALVYQLYRVALPPEAVGKSLQLEVVHLREKELPGEYAIAPSPPHVLLTSNIVKFLTKFSSGSGVKLLQGYMLRAS